MNQFINTLTKNPALSIQIGLYATAVLVPLLLKQPQLLVGTVVNAVLFVAAVKLSKKQLLPMAVLPSAAAAMNGVLFGGFTPFLLYFMPFIWAGNLILMLTFKYADKLPQLARVVLAGAVKSAFLFAIASIYVGNHIVPQIFLTAMGQVQLITALAGGIVAVVALKLLDNKADEPAS